MALAAECGSNEDPECESGDDNDGGNCGDGSGEGGASDDDLEIAEHDLVVDEGEFMTDITIEGLVGNNSDEMANYVQVTARIYDADGNQFDSYLDNTTDLAAGNSWSFENMGPRGAEDIDSYDIAIEDITW
ncbi:hypothetical protein C481_16412 [Natrialba asiatica DSM 12278]|uniref:Uncharacterized protein n=1 Tax=Natrialba asiatica (strain ATCC 700177 / DSM 12278 / JCM 9576 / FERM P-10747 / NBRC 102637 / 172P1) TaxID=29540 RepID=M0ALK4_NATA1|nr:hypothetical protein C481_16412 [Natrialba asiatica DSM 12278]